MLFAIHCLDHADALPRRLAHYEAHKAYLAQARVRTVMSGPLMSDDGERMIGSLFVVEAEDRAAVEAFNEADPFRRNGIWDRISIQVFSKRVDNR
jgi:uncharacterized protein YciI